MSVIKHCKLTVVADRNFWSALEWNIGGRKLTPDAAEYTDVATDRPFHYHADKSLAIALGNGLRGEAAIAWAAAEDDRLCEEQFRSSAIRANATAMESLASAIRSQADQSVVDRVMRHLTEPTQWALRKQLAGTGLISSTR